MEAQIKLIKNLITPLFLILVILNLTVGCSYQLADKTKDSLGQSFTIPKDAKIIVHTDEESFLLTELTVDNENQSISGIRDVMLPDHWLSEPANEESGKYGMQGQRKANEIHIYMNSYEKNQDGSITIKMPEAKKLEVKDPKDGAIIFTVIGIILLSIVAIIVILIVLILASSCPFVYAFDGLDYKFIGELYPGAIGKNMERHDILAIPGIKVEEGQYLLKVSNELEEIQYTDVLELWLVDHPENMQVSFDNAGNLHHASETQIPISATTDQGNDMLEFIAEKDMIIYPFTDEVKGKNEFSSIDMHFNKPVGVDQAKLTLTMKNSLWLDYVYSDFLANWGSTFDEYQMSQKFVPSKTKEKWTKNEGIQLAIKVKTEKGWELASYQQTVGPAAMRDLIIPLDNIPLNEEEVTIRLECAYHFWELDYAAIDYSENTPLEIQKIFLTSAIDEKGNSIKDKLLLEDKDYYIQPEIGNQAILSFKSPGEPLVGYERSVFLHSKGYYEFIKEFSHQADYSTALKAFQKGGFANYAKQKMMLKAGIE